MAELETQKTITCRPHRIIWIISLGVLFCPASFYFMYSASPMSTMDTICFAIFIAMCLGLGVPLVLMSASYVTASVDGLTWRTWIRKEHVSWEQVQAYYLMPMLKPPGFCVVETTRGKIKFTEAWTNIADFKNCVQQYARNAEMTSWELLGTDPRVLRQVEFTYPIRSLTNLMIGMLAMLLSLLAFGEYKAIGYFSVTASSIGYGWAWGSVAMGLAMPGLFLGFAYMAWISFSDAKRHGAQTISTDHKGIACIDNGQSTHVDWDRVADKVQM